VVAHQGEVELDDVRAHEREQRQGLRDGTDVVHGDRRTGTADRGDRGH
jgi:hypothetical protein